MKRAEAIKIRQAIEQGANSLPADVALEVPALFKKWTAGEVFEEDQMNEVRQYNGILYKIVQPHTTQAHWTPDITPALWKVVQPEGVIPDFVQPTGVHDAYMIGEKVNFEGSIYESLIDNNVYSPTAYPQGWKKL